MARTRATARHPQGWFFLVEQLAVAADRDEFLSRMLELQCKIVAAEYGAIWSRGDDGKPKLASAWPQKVAAAADENPVMRLLLEAASSGFDKKVSHVLHIDEAGSGTTGGGGPHAFVTVMRRQGQVEAVVTAVTHVNDVQVIQSTAAVREIAAGFYDGFEARQDAAAQRAEAERVRIAMALLAVSQDAPGFRGACLNLVNELVQQFKCTRVSLGWVRGQQVRLVAISDTEHLKRHSEQVALTELAMAECLDQQQAVLHPLIDDAEPLLQQAVVYAHRRLVGQPGKHVLSIPLRYQEQWLGVLTLERGDQAFESQLITQLQLIADVLTPHLADRRRGDRWLAVHAWHTVRNAAAYVVGPRYVGWKITALTVAAALIYCLVGTWQYRISAPFTLEAQHKQFISAPYEAAIKSVHVKKGSPLKIGDVLAILETDERKLELDGALANRATHEQAKQDALGREDKISVEQHSSRILQIEAHIAQLRDQIRRATLISPIEGDVLRGQWHDKIGSVVEQGKQMFEIAPIDGPDDLVAVLHVDERDIDQLRSAVGQHDGSLSGEMATRSAPGQTFEIVLTRIAPMAEPRDGVNGFEVRCRIIDSGWSMDVSEIQSAPAST